MNNHENTTLTIDSGTAHIITRRGSNYTLSEDVQLCNSWLLISADPILGREQIDSNLWIRIKSDFDEKLKQCSNYKNDRSPNSLTCRWNFISKEVSKFCDSYTQAKACQQSGTNPMDVIKTAYKLYSRSNKKPFTFVNCWSVLYDAPKWKNLAMKRKTKESSSSNNNNTFHDATTTPTPTTSSASVQEVAVSSASDLSPRPIKRKVAKQVASADRGTQKLIERHLSQWAQFLHQYTIEMKKSRWLLESKLDLSVMMTNLEGMDEIQTEYFKICQKEILEKCKRRKRDAARN